MKQHHMGYYFWKGFTKPWGPLGLAISFALPIIIWVFAPSTSVPLIWVVLFSALVLVTICSLISALFFAVNDNELILPRVISGREPPAYYSEDYNVLLILEPSELFARDHLLSLYLKVDNFEELVGFGRVLNVQDDGLIQVGLINRGEDREIFQKIRENNASVIKTLLVKSQVPDNLITLRVGRENA